jgi:AcrR family transcriptional regulator
MAHKLDHLREKAVMLRTQKSMTLDEIVERLSLPKTTVYYWIKDIPIPRTERQTAAQRKGTEANRARYAALRDAAYQQGWDEAPALLQDSSFRDFVVLYMAEGYKRNKNVVSFVNSDTQMIKLAHRWMKQFAARKLEYQLQCHADHDEGELKQYWGNLLGIDSAGVKTIRKSNSGELSGRQFRSVYGVLTVRTSDTYFRARLQAWMDYVKEQW